MPEETEGQIEATPTSPESSTPEDAQSQTQPEEAEVATQTQDGLQTEAPVENVKERTRDRIQQLAEKAKTAEQALEELRKRKSVFDEFMPQTEAPAFVQQQEPPQLQQYVDESGTVDISKFDNAMKQYHQTMQIGSQRAMQTAQQVERRIQERDAYTKYPELDPINEGHDEDFKQLVAAKLAMSWANNQNKTLVQVADEVSKVYAKKHTEEAIAKKAVEQYKEAQVNREQGPMEKGRGADRQEVTGQKLKEISRKGTREQQDAALAERLKRMGL